MITLESGLDQWEKADRVTLRGRSLNYVHYVSGAGPLSGAVVGMPDWYCVNRYSCWLIVADVEQLLRNLNLIGLYDQGASVHRSIFSKSYRSAQIVILRRSNLTTLSVSR